MAVQIIFLIAQLLLIVGLVSFIAWRLARDISGYYDVPFIVTSHRMLPTIAQALDIRAGDVVYDLGCGDGRLLFYCAKRYPQARFIGIERNPLLSRFIRMKLRLTGVKNLSFREADIFDAKFGDATRIYAFLLSPVINRLYTERRFPAGVRLASRAFEITDRKADTVIELSQKPDKWCKHLLYMYQF